MPNVILTFWGLSGVIIILYSDKMLLHISFWWKTPSGGVATKKFHPKNVQPDSLVARLEQNEEQVAFYERK